MKKQCYVAECCSTQEEEYKKSSDEIDEEVGYIRFWSMRFIIVLYPFRLELFFS